MRAQDYCEYSRCAQERLNGFRLSGIDGWGLLKVCPLTNFNTLRKYSGLTRAIGGFPMIKLFKILNKGETIYLCSVVVLFCLIVLFQAGLLKPSRSSSLFAALKQDHLILRNQTGEMIKVEEAWRIVLADGSTGYYEGIKRGKIFISFDDQKSIRVDYLSPEILQIKVDYADGALLLSSMFTGSVGFLLTMFATSEKETYYTSSCGGGRTAHTRNIYKPKESAAVGVGTAFLAGLLLNHSGKEKFNLGPDDWSLLISRY